MKPADAARAVPVTNAPAHTRVGQFIGLFKPRIGLAIAYTALAGFAAAAGASPDPRRASVLFVAVLLASGAAGAFNQYLERDLDARMERTRRRPFATGEFGHGWGWPVFFSALLLGAVGLAAATTNTVTALFVFLGAFTYGVVYTLWLKRRTHWNIVVGGLAGSFAVLAGATAAGPHPGIAAWLLAGILLLWTPSHFWSLAIALRRDYAAAAVPMLPVVRGVDATARVVLGNTVVLVAATLLPALFGMGRVYLATAVLGGAYFLAGSVRLIRNPTPAAAVANFHASLIQLGLLLTGVIASAALNG